VHRRRLTTWQSEPCTCSCSNTDGTGSSNSRIYSGYTNYRLRECGGSSRRVAAVAAQAGATAGVAPAGIPALQQLTRRGSSSYGDISGGLPRQTSKRCFVCEAKQHPPALGGSSRQIRYDTCLTSSVPILQDASEWQLGVACEHETQLILHAHDVVPH
jgi:hypothetical protein